MDCIFCKIINGDIPVKKVYEDDKILAFHDANPQSPVHILFVTKEHIKSAADINNDNSELVAHIFKTISSLAVELHLANGFRVVTNCGDSAGQSVKHLHFHLMSGRDFSWPPG
jgi:histidine triad (HIT) family protein